MKTLLKIQTVGKSIDLMEITSGDVTIAILYFHLVGKNVYFYLQGINYESDKKLKPGLVCPYSGHTILFGKRHV